VVLLGEHQVVIPADLRRPERLQDVLKGRDLRRARIVTLLIELAIGRVRAVVEILDVVVQKDDALAGPGIDVGDHFRGGAEMTSRPREANALIVNAEGDRIAEDYEVGVVGRAAARVLDADVEPQVAQHLERGRVERGKRCREREWSIREAPIGAVHDIEAGPDDVHLLLGRLAAEIFGDLDVRAAVLSDFDQRRVFLEPDGKIFVEGLRAGLLDAASGRFGPGAVPARAAVSAGDDVEDDRHVLLNVDVVDRRRARLRSAVTRVVDRDDDRQGIAALGRSQRRDGTYHCGEEPQSPSPTHRPPHFPRANAGRAVLDGCSKT
jgi:hypothetical protein